MTLTPGAAATLVADILSYLATMAYAILFVIAILRYRLFDMDLVINRTVLYGSVTALLIAGVTGMSELSHRVIQAVTGRAFGSARTSVDRTA